MSEPIEYALPKQTEDNDGEDDDSVMQGQLEYVLIRENLEAENQVMIESKLLSHAHVYNDGIVKERPPHPEENEEVAQRQLQEVPELQVPGEDQEAPQLQKEIQMAVPSSERSLSRDAAVSLSPAPHLLSHRSGASKRVNYPTASIDKCIPHQNDHNFRARGGPSTSAANFRVGGGDGVAGGATKTATMETKSETNPDKEY